MTFESPLELYLHLYGWKQYNNFWSILAYTGILYLPLAWLLVENVLRSTKQAETAADAAVMSRRPLLIEMGMALFVIALAVTPFSAIQAGSLSYINPCIAQQQGSLGATGTTYDTAFDLTQDEIKIPLWWKLVLAVSYGLNRAAITGLGCTEDITLVRQAVQETKIKDPLLAQELGDFREQCFYRARSEFANQLKEPLARTQWTQVKAAQGWEDADLEWEGSRVYLEWAQFNAGSGTASVPVYRLLHAQYPVPGFAFDPNRETDQNYEQQIIDAQVAAGQPFVVNLAMGIPYCNEWWLGTTAGNGLRTRLLETYPQSWVEWATGSKTTKLKPEVEDDFLKSLVKTEMSIPFDGNALGSDYVSGFSASFASDTGQAFLDIL